VHGNNNAIGGRLTSEMKDHLVVVFSEEEVHQAIQSPRPVGFSVGFYQKHWATVVSGVCNAILFFLNGS
jgi:hypothetical protein